MLMETLLTGHERQKNCTSIGPVCELQVSIHGELLHLHHTIVHVRGMTLCAVQERLSSTRLICAWGAYVREYPLSGQFQREVVPDALSLQNQDELRMW